MIKPEISVLANSLPRGGPFLLSSALALLGYQKYAGSDIHGTPAAFNYREAKKALKGKKTKAGENMIGISPFAPCYVDQALMHDWLTILASDEYIMAHIPVSTALSVAMKGVNNRHIVIIRDPRSLLLSLLFDTHPMPRFLMEPFAQLSAEEQLNFMLSGGQVPQSGMVLKPFAEMYHSMMSWLDRTDCLVVRFEDLVGPRGGGSRDKQRNVLKNMATYLDLMTDEMLFDRLDDINDPSSTTFRLDQMKYWEKEVGEKIVEQVLVSCEPLMRDVI